MTIRKQAILEYRSEGASRETGNVIKLAEAQRMLEERTRRLAPALQSAKVEAGFLGAVSQSATAKIGSLTNQIGPLGAGLGFVARTAPLAGEGLLRAAAGAEKSALAIRLLNGTLIAGTSAMLAGGVAAAAMGDSAVRAADTYATLTARIRTFSDGAIQAAQVERDLYANARDARVGVEGQVTLYTRLAPAVRDYGKAQSDALEITKLVSKAQAIQGADVREQLASTVQFSQAIASGVMRGDEFRSLMESAPTLMRYIAQNFERDGSFGVAFSSLRGLAEEGQLTTDKVLDALQRARVQIEADFENAPKRAQQGWLILTDAITRTVGEVASLTGAQQGLFEWLAKLADKADQFRENMLLNPNALEPVKASIAFMGEAMDIAAMAAGGIADNFDLIVTAGQAVIALKLGHVFASWFAQGMAGLQAFSGNLAAMRANAALAAGAAMTPQAAAAASALRANAMGLEVRAAELKAAAELKLAQATAARTAAYNAANRVNQLSIQFGAQDVRVKTAQAESAAVSAAATRAEAQAKTAATAATNAATAASTRNAVANEAEALATANVTRATVAKTIAARAASAAYAALGGPIGVATLLLGGLAFAYYKANEAQQAAHRQMLDQVDATARLENLNQRLTSATWAQVPALQAEAEALREGAAAARAKAQANLEEARSRRIAAERVAVESPEGLGLFSGFILNRFRATENRAQEVADAGDRGQFTSALTDAQKEAITRVQERARVQNLLSSGIDEAGRPLSASRRQELESKNASLGAQGAGMVDSLQSWLAQKDAQIASLPKGSLQRNRLEEDRERDAERLQTYSELATMGAASKFTPPAPREPSGSRTSIPAAVNQVLTELLEQTYLPKGGRDAFSMQNGLITGKDGSIFSARSDDEAAAAAKYVKQIQAINAATDAQIAKAGQSRQALREAASAMLAHAVETSKASQANEKWAEIQAEMSGESRAVIKAQRDLNRLMEDGAAITREAADAYLAYTEAREKVGRLQRGVQTATPFAQQAFGEVMAGAVVPTTARGALDPVAATAQVEAARAAIIARSETLIREDIARRQEAGLITAQDAERESAEAIAANRIAVEMMLQARLTEIRVEGAASAVRVNEAFIQKQADIITGALSDIAMGGDMGEIGREMAKRLYASILEELLLNPMREQIVTLLRAVMGGSAGGSSGGGLLGKLFNLGVSAFSGGFGGGGLGAAISALPTLPAGFDPAQVAGTILARRSGGRVEPGHAYLVGERRPEIMVPDRPGMVVPNIEALSGGGNRNTTVVVTQHNDLRGATGQEILAAALEENNAKMAKAVTEAISRQAGPTAYDYLRRNHIMRG